MPRRDAVLFDLDGVLVDSRAPITGCINHALVAHGAAERRPSDLERFIGPPLAQAFAELTGSEPGGELVLSCISAYHERYAEASVRDTTVVPGIAEALKDLGRDHRLAVATSKPRAFAEPVLGAVGLRDCFEVVAGPELGAHTEDKATTIASALAALGAPGAVMVGDRFHDVVGARANGLPCIGVLWGIGSADELTRAGAACLVDGPAALPGAIRA
jgi:phosphoglycolate phosphatase